MEQETKNSFILRAKKRGDLVTTTVQELNDDSKRGSIVIREFPRNPILRFCVLDESVVRRDNTEPPPPYAPPEPDEEEKRRVINVAVRAASLLRSCSSTPSSFGELLGSLDPCDLSTLTTVVEKEPLYDIPHFPEVSTFPCYRYRCVIYAPLTWAHQKGSTWRLSRPSEPVGALPRIKGPFAPSIAVAIRCLRRDLEVKMEMLLEDKMLAVRTEWILAPLREKVGWVPGHEREIEGRVWGGG